VATQPIVVGGTYEWFLNPASINTEAAPQVFGPWDLTGATVTISFMYYGNGPNAPPTVGGMHFTATILTPNTNGQAKYINATTLFNVAGVWGVSWKLVKGGTVLESQIVFFQVYPSGAVT
jgi:hypothetical protein